MKSITEICNEVFDSMPPETRFNAQDAERVRQYYKTLSGLQNVIIVGFYDILYTHPGTLKILENTERSKSETMLNYWWHKTIGSDFDGKYWEWQVYVGLVHIKHNVTNAMMISMWSWLLETLRAELKHKLPVAEVNALMLSFSRLATTIQALIAESYLVHYVETIETATGFRHGLVTNMVRLQIDGMIEKKFAILEKTAA